MRYLKIICTLVCTFISTLTFAHDFFAKTADGQIFYFNITSTKSNTVELTYEGQILKKNSANYKGDVTIPSKVKFKDREYTVTAIGNKAFSGATNLTGVIMPSGIESIGSFAFENCNNLTKIIFSGTNSKMGEGVFFGCTSITSVSIGSDWTTLNLKMFMWSDSLKTITVPAKVKTLYSLKSLRVLEEINVDVNNSSFLSVDGILYNKDGKLLLGCPRAYAGDLKIREGVESIYYGALIDCPYITSIDLPTSLKQLSYIEFSRMNNLTQITMRSLEPISTAEVDGEKVFALKILDKQNFKLVISRSAKKMYESSICSKDGEYAIVAEMPANTSNIPLATKESELVGKQQITTVKTFPEN